MDVARDVTALFDAQGGGGGGAPVPTATATATPPASTTPTGPPVGPQPEPDPSATGKVNRKRGAKLIVGCGPVACTVSARVRITALGKRIGRLKAAGPVALTAGQQVLLKLKPSRQLRPQAARRAQGPCPRPSRVHLPDRRHHADAQAQGQTRLSVGL